MKRIVLFAMAIALVLPLTGQTGRKESNLYVIAHLDEKLPSDANIVYAPTMRAAWTMLKDDIIGEDIILTKSLSLTAALNSTPFRVPENGDWLAMSGFVENGIVGEIDRSMRNRFGINNSGLDKYTNEEGIVCYSYFHKTVRFTKTFESIKWNFSDKDGTSPIWCFGVSKGQGSDKEAAREQVRIYDYRNPDDFIVRILFSDPGKEAILAKIPYGGTLSGMMRDIDGRLDPRKESRLSEIDELVIPKIKFDVIHQYDEFQGLHLRNKGFEKYFFVHMEQNIGFTLDESGAEAKATGEIVLIKGPASRLYIFDRPFLVILRDRDSNEPDLVVWVDNKGILELAE